MAKILIIRLSAIGDVAMTVPVIYSAAKANPEDTFTVLTQTFLIPVFINRPENVNIVGINTKGSEKKLSGLLKFVSALVKYHFDVVLDLHNVLRTMFLTKTGFATLAVLSNVGCFIEMNENSLSNQMPVELFHLPTSIRSQTLA